MYRADAAHRLAAPATVVHPLAAEEPARGGLSGAPSSRRLRRPPPLSETETPRLTQSPSHGAPRRSGELGRPPACWRSSDAGSAGTLRPPPETRFLEPSRVSAAPGGHERTAAQRGPDRRRWQILSTRVQRKARGTVRRSARPRAVHPAGRGAPRRPRTPVLRRTAWSRRAPRPRAAAAEATLREAARAALPERNRRPTWLILPVAYACLKD